MERLRINKVDSNYFDLSSDPCLSVNTIRNKTANCWNNSSMILLLSLDSLLKQIVQHSVPRVWKSYVSCKSQTISHLYYHPLVYERGSKSKGNSDVVGGASE